MYEILHFQADEAQRHKKKSHPWIALETFELLSHAHHLFRGLKPFKTLVCVSHLILDFLPDEPVQIGLILHPGFASCVVQSSKHQCEHFTCHLNYILSRKRLTVAQTQQC